MFVIMLGFTFFSASMSVGAKMANGLDFSGFVWAVIIGGYEGSTRVVALAAPTEHFSSVDLSSFGGSVCDYIAYIDQYTG